MTCDHCDGTGQIWESCGCSACEYNAGHSRFIPCANCQALDEMRDDDFAARVLNVGAYRSRREADSDA